MPKTDKIEYEKRIRVVQEWIIEDWPSVDIIANIGDKWGLESRQAKRYISEARKRWVEDEQTSINNKRRLKIESLKKLKRSLRDHHKGTPGGINAILRVEREIIKLDGIERSKKIELGGMKGQPVQTEQVATVLILPPNGRELQNAAK